MARKKRILAPETYYHVFNRGVAKMSIVQDDQDRRIFLKFVIESVREYKYQLQAYCLMTNHFHLLLKTTKVTLDRIMWHIQSRFARRINLRHDRIGPVFQGRYQDRIVDTDAYVLKALRYIHRNPVEAKMVQKSEDYPWSSYGCYIGKTPKWEWLDIEWGLKLFDGNLKRAREALIRFHGQDEDDPTITWP